MCTLQVIESKPTYCITNIQTSYQLGQVRCHFTPGHSKCDRCEDGNHECAPRSRKKRKTAPFVPADHSRALLSYRFCRTQEELQLRSREQDEQIRSLLSQFDRLRMEAKVTEWQRRAAATQNVGGLLGTPRSTSRIYSDHSHTVFISPSRPPSDMPLLFCPYRPTRSRCLS